MKVGLRAHLKSGPQGSRDLVMAQYYDIVARTEFADRAFRGDEDFDVDVVCMRVDQEILARAESRYDLASMQRKADRVKTVVPRGSGRNAAPTTPPYSPRGNVGRKHKHDGCGHCGMPGHKESACWAKHGRPDKSDKWGAWSKKHKSSR